MNDFLVYTSAILLTLASVAYVVREVWRNLKFRTRRNGHGNDGDSDGIAKRISNAYDGKILQRVERSGVIIPEYAKDTIECDDVSDMKECAISDGTLACFNCAESRFSLRLCAHFDTDVVLHDDDSGRVYTIPKNSSVDTGYCVKANVAAKLRDTRKHSRVRKRCQERNGHWVLARLTASRDTRDSSFNFICRCKYPHLLTNLYELETECSRDVACNGHGHLDESLINGDIDPMHEGTCVCDDGWIGDRKDTIGPFCREATFEEWPSFLYGERRRGDELYLYDERVSRDFSSRIQRNRMDGERDVWLPNPCAIGGCGFETTNDGQWFCTDKVVFDDSNDRDEASCLKSVSIAVRRDRDYLRGNGGALPNYCVKLENFDRDVAIMQFMSQNWNDGSKFVQEIGFVIDRDSLGAIFAPSRKLSIAPQKMTDRQSTWYTNESYQRFVKSNFDDSSEKRNTYFGDDKGIIWTYNDQRIEKYREVFNVSFGKRFRPTQTDLSLGMPSGGLSVAVPFYYWDIVNCYYLAPPRDKRFASLAIQPIY